ncbi:MAG: hypothetical protein ACKOA8_18560 [Deltaproteobacteria bacterium]
MKYPPIRSIYLNCARRLTATFLVLTAIYFPLAVRWPKLILILGPLLFGYSHLLASYCGIGTAVNRPKTRFFLLLSLGTLFAFAGKLVVRNALFEIPFGSSDVMVSVLVLLLVHASSHSFSFYKILVCTLLNALILTFAWQEPLWVVGGILIVHNWVAFFYWIRSSRTLDRKLTAFFALAVFAILHWTVARGFFDSFFPAFDPEMMNGTEITGWYLASWSSDPKIWYRAVVIYAYGISIHYFIWLKAIPESQHRGEAPYSFRRTLDELKTDLGGRMAILVRSIGFLGMGVWCFSSSWGRTLYFELAALHGWLEIVFMLM